MATKLEIYNGALRNIGERKLSSLTENREPRRVLDDVWDQGAVNYVLRQGLWNFANRTVRLDYDATITPSFGFDKAFERPEDFVRLSAIGINPFFDTVFSDYNTEGGFWFANLDNLYVRYVSNGASYGANLLLWPEDFRAYVEAYVAFRIALRLTSSKKIEGDMFDLAKTLLAKSKAIDAQEEGTRQRPDGQLVGARRGYGRGFGRNHESN